MNLIIIDASEVGASGEVRLSRTRAAHLRDVLKVAPGSEVRVGILDGPCGVGAVTAIAAIPNVIGRIRITRPFARSRDQIGRAHV